MTISIRARRGHWLLWGALLLAACNASRDLRLRDDGIFMPSVRFLHEVGGEDDAERVPLSLGIEVNHAEGDPTSASEYALTSVQLVGQARVVEREGLHATFLFQLEAVDFEVEDLSVPAPNASSHLTVGPGVGLDLGIPIAGPFEAYGRGTFSAMLHPSTSARAELGLRYSVQDAFRIYTAYRWWRYRYEEDSGPFGLSDELDVDIATEGLMVGMEISF